MNSNTSHTACTDAHTLSAHHIAPTPCSTSVALLTCVPKIIVSFHLARCLLLRTEHPALHPLPCSHPELPALIHENPGVTEKLIQNLAHKRSNVMSVKTSLTHFVNFLEQEHPQIRAFGGLTAALGNFQKARVWLFSFLIWYALC